MSDMFLKTTVIPYINFIIFLVMLIYFMRKPIAAMFADRRESFLAFSKSAEKKKKEAENINKKLTSQFSELEAHLASIKEKAIQDAEMRSKEMVAQAEKMAANIKTEAEKISDAEVIAAKQIIQDEIVYQVKKATKERIEKDFDHDKHIAYLSKETKKLEGLSI